MKESGLNRLLAGKEYKGKKIKEIFIKSKSRRLVKFTDGTQMVSNKKNIEAFKEVELDLKYRKIAERNIVKHRDGSVSTVLGGEEYGLTKTYKSLDGAERAIKRYYHADYKKYLKGEKSRKCIGNTNRKKKKK